MKTAAGGGWILYGADSIMHDEQDEWATFVASASFPMGLEATITVCELEACLWGVSFMTTLVADIEMANHNLVHWKPLAVQNIPILLQAELLQ